MQEVKLQTINDSYYHEVLDNGLEIVIISNPLISEQSAKFLVRCGSNDVIDYAPGIAHFLEHTKFAKKDGDYFDDFSKYGADCNAYTNYQETAYYFTCNQNFYDNLKVLINMMQESNFTKEVVDKEFSIICQEINMYKQMPDSVINNMLFNAISQKEYKHDIAGEIIDIETIDNNKLQSVYDHYYVANNMTLAIATNHDVNEVIKFIKENINLKINDNINFDYTPETSRVNEEELIKIDNKLTTSLSSYVYKLDKESSGVTPLDLISLEVYRIANFSKLNPDFVSKLANKELDETLSVFNYLTMDLSLISFDANTNDKSIAKAIDDISTPKFELFEMALNSYVGSEIKKASNKRLLIEKIQELMFVGIDPKKYFDMLLSVDINDLYKNVNKLLANKKTSLIMLKNDKI